MIFPDFVKYSHHRLDLFLKNYISNQTQTSLDTAINYVMTNPGKRIRALLVYATGRTFGAPWESLDAPAAAVELIHTYSLTHDDLPAMDNADLRRGKPACHKAFGEALAILTGDALQPLAFEILVSHSSPLESNQRLKMIYQLSHACGKEGMALGQTLDMAGCTSLSELHQMYLLKTGALISASIQMGLIAANVDDMTMTQAFSDFSTAIGLGFQLQDDLLDTEDHFISGKTLGLDIQNKKITYALLLGVDRTKEKIKHFFEEAMQSIHFLGASNYLLLEICNALFQRKN